MNENKLRTLNGGAKKLELIAAELNKIYQKRGYNTDLNISDSENEKYMILTIKTSGLYHSLAGQLLRAQVALRTRQDDILYEVSYGQWLDKALIGSATFLNLGMAILLPVVLVGIVRQINFYNDIEADIIKLHSELT